MLNQIKKEFSTGWSKYYIAAVLTCLVFIWLVSPAYPVTPPTASTEKTLPAPKAGSQAEMPSAPQTGSIAAELKDLKQSIEELQKSALDQRAMILESERKRVDWWLAYLAAALGMLALLGAIFPFIITKTGKEEIDKNLTSVKELKKETEKEIEKFREETKYALLEFHKKEEEAFQNYTAGTQASPEQKSELNKELASVQSDPASDYKLKLRAKAITASENRNAQEAYASWNALSLLAPTDALAALNAGYWAGKLAEQTTGNEQIRWLKQLSAHSQAALALNPNLAAAASNWGVALANEAQALAKTDLPAARALWQQAAAKHQQALRIKPDFPDAANNWGSALGNEAKALANTDLPTARALWQQAAAKYQQALRIKPDYHEAASNWGVTRLHEAKAIETEEPDRAQALLAQAETLLLEHAQAAPGAVAYNLACIYARRQDVENSLKWLETSRQHQTLEDCLHLRTDSDLDAIRQHPDFAAWLQSVCPQGDTAS